MYKCCFWACFCARQRARWLRAELTYHTFRKSYQTAGPIDTKFGTHVQIHLGMDIRQKIALRDTRGHLGVLGGHTSKSLGGCQTAGPIGTTFGTLLRIRLGMDIC